MFKSLLLWYCCVSVNLVGSANARLGEDESSSIDTNSSRIAVITSVGDTPRENAESSYKHDSSTAFLHSELDEGHVATWNKNWNRESVRMHQVEDLFSDKGEDELIQVFVGYKSDKGLASIQSMAFVPRKGDFTEIRAALVKMTKKQMRELEKDEEIEYIEPDYTRRASADFVPYGVKLVQGTSTFPTPSNRVEAKTCSNPNAFRVAIIDSGIYAKHVEFQCNTKTGIGCVGKSFGTSAAWNLDFNSHGTHCAGTIAALGGNKGVGLRGIVQDGLMCLVIGRVFPDDSAETKVSDVLNAVQWAVETKGAKVVSMSLSGNQYSTTESRFYQNLIQTNKVIVVAAAGNDGTGAKSYPASFKNVVSVAAVDSSLTRADFSQYNDMVDLTAPGVGIFSTVPYYALEEQQFLTTLSIGEKGAFLAYTMANSHFPVDRIGKLVACPDQGWKKCPGNGGHICVIERDFWALTFETQGLNCQKSGGVAAIIYNTESGPFEGMLDYPTQVKIPVVSMKGLDYTNTLAKNLGKMANLTTLNGYALKDGTSMATPHVTGAVAAIWRGCPKCNNTQVVNCLTSTAYDLGLEGRDDEYGHGLIQTKDAYDCLRNTCCSKSKANVTTNVHD